ncbi:hypothetical protein J6590_011796 [Homalodisca vitripennis]|nr:hypothetical protein J6590_011796 [Homalodisca vitripennis]
MLVGEYTGLANVNLEGIATSLCYLRPIASSLPHYRLSTLGGRSCRYYLHLVELSTTLLPPSTE